jgi:hypothetical protein
MTRSRRNQRRRPTTQLISESSAWGTVLSGDGLDADDHLFRPLTRSTGDNLPAFTHERMLAVAKYLSRTNSTGHRLLTLLSDFVFGEGVTLTFRNAKVQEVIERHWVDPDNEWDRRNPSRFRRLLRNGEYLMPLFITPGTGHMTIGSIPSENIKAVHTDPENWERVVSVELRPPAGQTEGKRYTIVNRRASREELEQAENPALYWALGNDDGPRGISILYPIADFLDLLDQFMFSEIERWFLIKAFIWRVTISGATPEQLAEYSKLDAFRTPKPGGVVLQNERITWEAIAPALNTYDSANGMRFLRNHILGTEGIPEHFFAEGGDVNRATGTVMAEPSRKRFTALQDEWRYVLLDVLQAQIDYAVIAGMLPEKVDIEEEGKPTGETILARNAVSVDMADLSPDDTAANVTSLKELIAAMRLAVDDGMISPETAQRVVWMLLGTLGHDVKPDEEQARIAAAKEQREKERLANAPQMTVAPIGLAQRAQERAQERRDGRVAD